MNNNEIIEAISVLNETLKTINPEGLPVFEGSVQHDTYIVVCEKIKQLTNMLYRPALGVGK